GDLSAALAAITESATVEEATGIRVAPYGALICSAWRGQTRETEQLIETTVAGATSRGEGIGIAVCDYAHAVVSNGLGHYEDAYVAARSASDHREFIVENWGLSELIEAATRTGRTDVAADALTRLAAKSQAAGTPWALGIEARS